MLFNGWLNNKYYRNISINLEAVATLPEDGDLSGLHSVSLDSTEDDTGSQETLDEDEDPYNTHLSGSFIPSTIQPHAQHNIVSFKYVNLQKGQGTKDSHINKLKYVPCNTLASTTAQ